MAIRKPLGTLLTLLMLAASQASAQEESGKREYINSCAACHGTSGHGDGPLAELLTVEVSDLTKLSANNGGTFPLDDIMRFVDGRSSIRAHGQDMPVWGERFVAEASNIVTRYEAEKVAQRRLLALALYLQTVQD